MEARTLIHLIREWSYLSDDAQCAVLDAVLGIYSPHTPRSLDLARAFLDTARMAGVVVTADFARALTNA